MVKKNEKQLAEDAAAQLRDQGFLIEVDAVVESGRRGRTRRADILAWSNKDDRLRPALVVEVVGKGIEGPAGRQAIEQVLSLKSAHPGADLYLFDGTWHRVDGVRAVPASRPELPGADVESDLSGAVLDGLAARVLVDQIFDVQRPEAHRPVLQQVLHEALGGRLKGELARALFKSPEGRNALAKKIQLGLMRDKKGGPLGAPLALSTGMARLLLPEPEKLGEQATVLDPWCGFGSCLFGVGEWAAQAKARPLLTGLDRLDQAVDVTEGLLSLAGYRASSSTGSVLDLPPEMNEYVVSLPPLGLKLDKESAAKSGARFMEVAAIRSIVASLKPGGRAVIATGAGFLFRGGEFAALREELATTKRVVAAIELPGGILEATNVALCLLVVENAEPRDTLTARLSDDWEEQLAEGGQFYQAYLDHLKGEA